MRNAYLAVHYALWRGMSLADALITELRVAAWRRRLRRM